LHIAVDRPSVQSSGRRTLYQDKEGWSAIDLGDLAAGYNRWLVGRTLRGGDQRLTFQLAAGIDADEPLASAAIDLHTRKTNPALKALFGARRINTLEHLATAHCEPEQITEQLARLGYDLAALLNELQGSQQTPKKVYAENRADQTIALMRRLLVKESLHFGLASSEAAFVAVRSEKGAHVDDTVFVANALPAGWSEDFLQSAAPPPLAAGNLIVRQALQTSVMQRSPGGAHPNMSAPASRMVQSVMQTEMQITTASAYQTLVIFSGTPVWAGTESLLFDSRSSPLGAFETLTLSRITVKRYSNNRQNVESQRNGSQAEPQDIDRSIQLLIFIGDLAAPRARIRLADLLRTGTRPLNLTRQRDEVLRVVLWNERGATRSPELPAFELSLQ
jgi:Ca-activated chloride channel family protein